MRDEATRGFTVETSNHNTIQAPLVGIANTAMRDCMRYAIELGLSPSSRTRVTAVLPETDGRRNT